jgi:hypothetical protein
LGQHPNILPLPESAWLGDFAIDLGTQYSTGSARGPFSHLSSVGVQKDKFFAHFGDAIHRLILRHRKRIDENLDEVGFYGFHDLHPGFKTERVKSEPKSALGGWNSGKFLPYLRSA